MKRSSVLVHILLFTFLLLALIVFIQPLEIEAAEKNEEKISSEKNLRVSARIPVFQQLDILEQKTINYSLLMQNYDGSREIIVEKALTVKLMSNSAWYLRLNSSNEKYKLMIKRTEQNSSKWQKLNATTAKFNGRNGIEVINFDLKIIVDSELKGVYNDLDLGLRFSLDPLLY